MPFTKARLAFACATALLALPAGGVAQETPSDTLLTVDHYLDWETVADPQISPDGSQVVYTRRWVDKLADRWQSAVWIMNADGSQNRFLVEGSQARWSPDGTRILYVAQGEPQGAQIFVRWMDHDGPSTQVTRVQESPSTATWSPDGRSIAFVMLVPDHESWPISMPAAPAGAKWTPAPRMEDQLHYRQDRVGFTTHGHTHLFVVPADGGTARQLTSGAWNVGARFDDLGQGAGLDFTPDGKTLVFDGWMESDGDDIYERSNIYALDLASGAIRDLTGKRPGFWAGPAVSPDGRTVAFAGYDSTADTHETAALWTMGLDGSGMKSVSGDLDRDPGDLHWAPDGSGIYFAAGDQGSINVYLANAGRGGVRKLTDGVQTLGLSSVSHGLVAVGVQSDPQQPDDVVRYDLRSPGTLIRLTHVNDDVLHGIKLGQVEEIRYASTDGFKIQGWVVKPPNFDPHKKYPLILHIHGGPYAMYDVAFNYSFQNFAADGFVVLYVNPRGSTGYGTTFSDGIDHSYPSGDYDDLMAGVDTVIGRGYVDTSRLYVTGCSGGGVLSSWVVGHTQRFAAAAVRCPVIDWMSFIGETDIPYFTQAFFRKPFWEDPSEWLSHSSLMHVGNVTTPTLLMTGELDRRTPIPQTEEFYAALKMRGIPTRLLRFNGEFHGTGSLPSNFMRTQLYIMSWFDQYPGKGK